MKISHLCFADDLLIFCKGDMKSISLIKECLNSFRDMSGLSPNSDKSHLFTCGVAESIKGHMLDILGYREGVLPIRYLGVPLISSRLKKSDCSALVERMVTRVRSWTCRVLSYAGRLQLVNSVLFAIQVYWSSMFMLPKGVVKQVEEQILRSFLWKGSELSNSGAKVAWETLA